MTSRLQPPPLAAGAPLADVVPVYHNSGPVPNNAYRTGAVGVQMDISSYFIVSTLLKTAKLAHSLEGCANSAFGVRLHPSLIHGAACSALVRLNASAAVTRSARAVIKALASNGPPQGARTSRLMVDSAIASIGVLRDVLRDHQLLPPFHGVVSCAPYDYVTQHKPMPWLLCRADDRIVPLAWGLVAIACASPPIVLLNRQPSLMWFRTHHSLMVRWFGATVPLPSATAEATGASR